MAKPLPSYTLEEQANRLSDIFPSNFSTIESLKYRLLMACSQDGNLDSAKSRFINFIYDTELYVIFSAMLEVPSEKQTTGVNTLQDIQNKMAAYYPLIEKGLLELKKATLPQYTIDLLKKNLEANNDPVYKLSGIAAMVMLAIILDDMLNNRKE